MPYILCPLAFILSNDHLIHSHFSNHNNPFGWVPLSPFYRWGTKAQERDRAGPESHDHSHWLFFFFLFKGFIDLFIETHRVRERERGRERSRLHAESPTWDSIQGLQDHALGCRLNHCATGAAPHWLFQAASLVTHLRLFQVTQIQEEVKITAMDIKTIYGRAKRMDHAAWMPSREERLSDITEENGVEEHSGT